MVQSSGEALRHRAAVADPIYGLVDFGASPRLKGTVRDIIDRQAFQRLRHISQLGLASQVYPGATHTRFSHALGSAHLARRVLEHLGEARAGKDHWEAVVLAALLHDVGHGPFSHSFERAMDVKRRRLPDHERWTQYLITRVFDDVLDSSGIGSENVAGVLSKSIEIPKHLQQIVSSQLDVDRMDYLVRDAHFSGVSMGQIDVGYLIRSLDVIQHSGGGTSLGVVAKGVRAYEAYALARHQMSRSVYFHPLVAVFEFMMEECMRAASDAARDMPLFARIVPPMLRETACLEGQLDEVQADEYMARYGKAYVALTEGEIWAMVRRVAEVATDLSGAENAERAVDLARALLSRRPLTYFMIRPGRKELLERKLRECGVPFGTGRSGSAVGERCRIIPIQSTMYREGDGVFVLFDGRPTPVSELSFAIRAFQDRPESQEVVVLFDDKVDLDELVTPFVVRTGKRRLKPIARRPSYPPKGSASSA